MNLDRLLTMANNFTHCGDFRNGQDLRALGFGAREAAHHLHRADRSDPHAMAKMMGVLRLVTGRKPTPRDRRLFRVGFLGMLAIGHAAIASERETQ